VAGGRNLLFQRKHLALNRAFLGLQVSAHTRIALLASYMLNRFHEIGILSNRNRRQRTIQRKSQTANATTDVLKLGGHFIYSTAETP